MLYELSGLTVHIKEKAVLDALDCREDSPAYEQMAEDFRELYSKALALLEPCGILGVGTLPKELETAKWRVGAPVVYAVISVGGAISRLSTNSFETGDYVKGMLCEAIADEALFSLDPQVQKQLRDLCSRLHMGVAARLEAPQDISIEVQKKAFDFLELNRRFGIRITEGYMFDPIKTICQVFVLTKEEACFHAEHDCTSCPRLDCPRRSEPADKPSDSSIGAEIVVFGQKGETLLDALIREGIAVDAPCGGKGRCKKCRVRILNGNVPIDPEERAVFSQEELAQGWRLACLQRLGETGTVSLELQGEKEWDILQLDSMNGEKTKAKEVMKSSDDVSRLSAAKSAAYDAAVDIGTTTIAFALFRRGEKEPVSTTSCLNRQRAYGADVISRIQACSDGKAGLLMESIRTDLQNGLARLTKEAGLSLSQLDRVVMAGNTAMIHFLMGYPSASLGVYPFTPYSLEAVHAGFEQVLGSTQSTVQCKAEVSLFPGISSYVGGDITAGLYACGFHRSDELCLLVDLGTNGEMALGSRDRILTASAAAGPAFEGGNLSWGTGSVPGAICSVSLQNGKAEVETIRREPPVGICGTGAIELTAELLREGIVDDTGLMDDEYFDDGFPVAMTEDGRKVVMTQKDIREIQLAKAAIRAGIETLIVRFGAEKKDIARVYLAGGFGYRLDVECAIEIGMLPPELKGRIIAVGNSSLQGAALALAESDAWEDIAHIVSVSDEIALGADEKFQEYYMEYMMFPEQE